jgi:putative membrane protein
MHVGSALHLSSNGWVSSPGIIAPLLVSGALYARGAFVLWQRSGVGHGVRRWEVGCFVAGWLTLATALVSPLHELSEQLFWVHMVQHELLMVVAAPLFVLGRPLVPLLWALPGGSRATIGSLGRKRWWRDAWGAISHPAAAWSAQAIALWLWHVPSAFEATIDSELVHAAQHTTFLVTSLLFWWSVIHGCRRHGAYGAAVISLFTTFVYTGALGALLTFSRVAWYPGYALSSAAFGLTSMEDQQLAGLIMWLPASTSYLVAALALLVAWMRASELRVALRERRI